MFGYLGIYGGAYSDAIRNAEPSDRAEKAPRWMVSLGRLPHEIGALNERR